MLPFLRRLLKFGAPATGTASVSPVPGADAIRSRAPVDQAIAPGHEMLDPESEEVVWADVPRYPAYDQGFPIVPPAKLLAGYSKSVARLLNIATFDGKKSQEAVRAVLHRYADFVQGLPASYQEHYYGAGGLLKLGIDVGFHSLQGSAGVIFSKESADIRTRAEPRWKMAAFVAGIACEMFRTVSSMRVTNQKGDEWNPLVEPMSAWIDRTGATRYWVIWVRDDELSGNRAIVGLILPHILDAGISSYIGEERRALAMLYGALSYGVRPGDSNPLAVLVERQRYRLIQRDMARNPNHLGRPQIGSHIDPAIIDCMRSLVKTEIWTCNQKGSRVWITTEGCFIAWKQGGLELGRKLLQSEIPGVPSDVESIREIMQAHGITEANPSGRSYWQITPDGSKALVDAVKIARPELLFENWLQIADEASFKLFTDAGKTQNPSVTAAGPATSASASAAPKAKKATAQQPLSSPQSPARTKGASPDPSGESAVVPPTVGPPARASAEKPGAEETGASQGVSTVTPDGGIARGEGESGDALTPPPMDDIPPPTEEYPSGNSEVDESEFSEELPPPEPKDAPQRRDARELARMPKVVEALFRMLIAEHEAGNFKLRKVADNAVGIPMEAFDQEKTGVPLLPVLTSLQKEMMLYVPPGQAKKIITLVEDGQKREYIGIYSRNAKSLFGFEG